MIQTPRVLTATVLLGLVGFTTGCSADVAPYEDDVDLGEQRDALDYTSGASQPEQLAPQTDALAGGRRTPPGMGTITTDVGISAKAACTCADHPKPGYNCNDCSVINGRCWCFYGLKNP